MSQFNWGIAAPGNIAWQFAAAIQEADNAVLKAVASRSKNRASQFAESFGTKTAYGSYRELAEDPDIDAVYVASPHPFHKDTVIQMLNAGKPVLCEKPLGVNQSEVEAMIKAAKDNDVFLMEGMWTRFLPVMQEIKKRIINGQLGKIRMFRLDFSFQCPPDNSIRQLNPALAGGGLLDVGIYPLALTSWIMEEDPEAMVSQVEIGETGVDTQAAIIQKYRDGALASLTCGVTTRGPVTAEIIGSRGAIEIPRMFHSTDQAFFITEDGEESIHMPHKVNGFEWEIEAVQRVIRSGLKEHPDMPLDETLKLVKQMDELRQDWRVRYPFE